VPSKRDAQQAICGSGGGGTRLDVWDKQKRWWGRVLSSQPDALVAEFNGLARPERLVQLVRSAT